MYTTRYPNKERLNEHSLVYFKNPKVSCSLITHADPEKFKAWLESIPKDIDIIKIRCHSGKLWILTSAEVERGDFKP